MVLRMSKRDGASHYLDREKQPGREKRDITRRQQYPARPQKQEAAIRKPVERLFGRKQEIEAQSISHVTQMNERRP